MIAGISMHPVSTESSIGRICQSQREFLRRAARRLGAPEDEVEDLVQETLLIAHLRIEHFGWRSSIQTWLYGILRNVLSNSRRAWGRYERRLSLYAMVVDGDADCLPCWSEQILADRALQSFVAELDADKRDVFVLAEVMGCSGREIGKLLGINPNTAASRLRVARKAFAKWVRRSDL